MPSSTLTLSQLATRSSVLTGRIVTALVVLFMLFDGTIHLLAPAPVVVAFAQLGVPQHLSLGIALIELACTVLYVIPRTSTLGALLLTAYLGGATAIQLRAETALFPVIFPAIIGVLVWGGLVLRDEGVRAFIFRRA